MAKANGIGSKFYKQIIKHDLCVWCGEPSESIDHIHPRFLGGANHWMNFAPTCVYCNSTKGSMSMLEFMLWRATGGRRKDRAKFGNHKPIPLDPALYDMDGKWFDPLGIRGEHQGNEYGTLRV